ncbi:hypothetical protein HPG69_018787, partial [Diceros bicornis minor]
EWLNSLFLLLCLYLYPNNHQVNDFSSLPTMDLGQVDSFSEPKFAVVYTPVTNTTQQIMNKVASASFMKGCLLEEGLDIRQVKTTIILYEYKCIPQNGIYGDCPINIYCNANSSVNNLIGMFNTQWTVQNPKREELNRILNWRGSTEDNITTNHSVMEKLMSVTGKNMKIYPFIRQGGVRTDFFIFFCIISFSPFTYYASVNVTRERKRMKGMMTMIGLQDSAFWLSWGLLYAGFIFFMALFLALTVKYVQFVILTGFMVVFTLFLLYGLSLMALAFLMNVLVKKCFLTGLVVFLLTVFWGSLGFTALYRHLPASLEWILSLLSPFTFTLGMAQLLHLDYDLKSNAFPDPSDCSNLIIATNFMLAFDIFLYLVLPIYFDKILPNDLLGIPGGEQHEQRCGGLPENQTGKEPTAGSLRDLVFDVYEGQITAILGHSGAGKSTQLNILSGLSVPTKSSVTIYNNKLSETADLENISKLTGVCPQSNVHFDFLTMRGNLRLFAKIKGIQPREMDKEIQRVFLELEMQNIQDILVQNLSGGQKGKLTFGIAILGDPHIFLLDEPTAGLDPFSRHQVWSLLKEQKIDCVILFSIQFMDEVDILAGESEVCRLFSVSKEEMGDWIPLKVGPLKEAGRMGTGLDLQLNEICVQENITSLDKQRIADAKLSAESEGKLVYTLPLERTNKFLELYQDLDSCPGLGMESYGVSMTTMNEVFLKLEGKSAIDES